MLAVVDSRATKTTAPPTPSWTGRITTGRRRSGASPTMCRRSSNNLKPAASPMLRSASRCCSKPATKKAGYPPRGEYPAFLRIREKLLLTTTCTSAIAPINGQWNSQPHSLDQHERVIHDHFFLTQVTGSVADVNQLQFLNNCPQLSGCCHTS